MQLKDKTFNKFAINGRALEQVPVPIGMLTYLGEIHCTSTVTWRV